MNGGGGGQAGVEPIEPGSRFGRLTVVAVGEPYFAPSAPRKKIRRWICRCDCGNEILTLARSLRAGATTSCAKGACHSTAGPYRPRRKSDSANYLAAHKRVHRERGKASQFTCVDTGERAEEWSWAGCEEPMAEESGVNAGLGYCLHVDHYVPRTRKAHKAHDIALRKDKAA